MAVPWTYASRQISARVVRVCRRKHYGFEESARRSRSYQPDIDAADMWITTFSDPDNNYIQLMTWM
jgi:hypothetical protein